MNNIAKPIFRILAGLIDFSIVLFMYVYVIFWFSTGSNIEVILDQLLIAVIVFLLFGLLYPFIKSFLISTFGGTIGKLLTGTKIIKDGKNLSFWRAFLRNHIGYMISGVFLYLGFIWIFIDKERKGWHDMVADTLVVITNKSTYIIGIIFLIFITFINVVMVRLSIGNFYNNSSVYTEFTNLITDLQKESVNEINLD